MKAQNGSGQDGTAILGVSSTGDTVMIELSNGTSEPQPAHIHKGTCANLDPSPLVPLNPVVNGKSDTTIVGGVTTMVAGESYAINVHKSAAEASVYVSCGDITPTMTGSGTPGAMTTPGVSGETMNVTLNTQNASGQSGTAVLTKKGDTEVMVSLNLSNGTSEPQPAHIHKGTCANLDPSPAFPLTNVVDGKSESEVMVSMSELEKGGYAINIHKSAAEASVYVACGDITSAMMGMETPGMMGETTPVATP
jgi:FtsP/CotA-like multicopper oxidase with cupredoxin domain